MIRAGRYEIHSAITGWDRLDGGAMFGVVPKVLWQKTEDTDDDNRILMALRSLVAIDPEEKRVVVIDTGAGSKWDDQEAARFAITYDSGAIPRVLAPYGLTMEDVTDVIITHTHFDHAGGMTDWAGKQDGPTSLVFPNASHWVHESHWSHALRPTDRDRASFLMRDLELLNDSDRLVRLTGDEPESTIPGIRWRLSHGHTPYQLLPWFEDDDSPLLFVGDMIPTSTHLPPAWVMAYDLYPLKTLDERKALYSSAASINLRIAFPHDRFHGAGRLDVSGKRVQIAEGLLPSPGA